MPIEEANVAACLANVSQSADRVCRRNALKTLERSIIPGLCAASAIALLRGTLIGSGDGGNTPPSLYKILLSVIADDDTSEICREKAAIVLRECFHRVCSKDEDNSHSSSSSAGRKECLEEFYPDFCHVLYGRLVPVSSIGDDGGGLLGRAPPSSIGPAEKSEEIRLVLVETASDALSYMVTHGKFFGSERDSEEVKSPASIECEENISSVRSRLARASSTLCRALSLTGLSDPYPNLRRASCLTLILLADLFPEVVRDQAAPLLRPITGGSEANSGAAAAGSGGGLGAMVVAADVAAMTVAKTSSGCMVRHRHAKTRCLALEATSAVLMCSHTETEDGDNDDGSCVQKNGSILREHVLPCWEDFPPFDRSAAVRMALIKAVGKVAVKEFAPLQRSAQQNFRTKSLSGRLLVLLLMGMSDESESIRSASSDALAALAVAVFNGADNPDALSHINAASDNDVMIADLVSANSGDILSVLLPRVHGNLALERKVRGVQALEVLIRLVNFSVENDEQSTIVSSSAACVTLAAAHPLRTSIVEIALALCSFFGEEEAFARSSAICCGHALGACGHSASLVLAILLPSMKAKPDGEEKQTEIKTDEDVVTKTKTFLISSPRQYAAALTLLGSLVEGTLIDGTRNGKKLSHGWLGPFMGEILSTISCSRVLEVVALDRCSADALLDLCHTLVKCADMFWFSNAETNNQDEAIVEFPSNKNSSETVWGHSLVVDILSCCFQLLGCPVEFGLADQAIDLLDSIPGCDGHAEKSALLRLHFRDILKRIIGEDKAALAPNVVWTADDRQLHAFDSLLRNSGGMAVGENFDLVAPVLECLLSDYAAFSSSSDSIDGTQTKIDYTVKLSAMALVESIVSDPLFPMDLLHSFTAKLLDNVIIPNLVWRVGGMASSLRKVSAAALFSLLRCGGATTESLFQTAPRLLPVLKSNLEDDDASTRELIISSLAIIFELLPGALGEDAIHHLYPGLVKCMDDSSKNVRFAACDALRFFFRAAVPRHFKGTAIEYMVEQLLIHMDDPDRKFQSAVLDVLTVALDVDTSVVTRKAKEAQSSHRSAEFCRTLLRRADERLATEMLLGKAIAIK